MSLVAQPIFDRRERIALALALTLSLFIVSLAVGNASPVRPTLPSVDTRPIQLHWEGSDSSALGGSMYNVARQVGAPEYWSNGWTGAGVDIAVIDSGVSPVAGLGASGKVVYGPDVSFESGVAERRNLDTYGHGTHMAGIIAGRSSNFRGIAPDARIVSLKAADALGRTNVAQVVAAIKWVVDHRWDGDLNIRVLNLSFGAARVGSYLRDDLAYAVERAWHAGIVVVVSGGNGGLDSGGLSAPAYDPYVISVGADNTQGTTDVADDNIAEFSSRGDGTRNPDLVAPGKSIVSLRVPGSYLDTQFPEARVDEHYFKGSGTSQAAAVVSGAAALLISQKWNRTPDRIKQMLTSTAQPLPNAAAEAQGNGLLDLATTFDSRASWVHQDWARSQGSSSNTWANVDAAGNSWSTAEASGNSWSSNVWTANGWVGEGWDSEPTTNGNSWSSDRWNGVSWGKPKGGKVSGRPSTVSKCDWQTDKPGVAWGRKPKLSTACKSLLREYGISWGRRPKFGPPTGSDRQLDRYGVSWGRKQRSDVSPLPDSIPSAPSSGPTRERRSSPAGAVKEVERQGWTCE